MSEQMRRLMDSVDDITELELEVEQEEEGHLEENGEEEKVYSLGYMESIAKAMDRHTDDHSGTSDEEYVAYLEMLSREMGISMDDVDENWGQSGDYLHYHQRKDAIQAMIEWLQSQDLVNKEDGWNSSADESVSEDSDTPEKKVYSLHYMHNVKKAMTDYTDKNFSGPDDEFVNFLRAVAQEAGISLDEVDRYWEETPDNLHYHQQRPEMQAILQWMQSIGIIPEEDIGKSDIDETGNDMRKFLNDVERMARDEARNDLDLNLREEEIMDSIGAAQIDDSGASDEEMYDIKDDEEDAFLEKNDMRDLMNAMEGEQAVEEDGKPSEAETYQKIKGWDAKALAGYARKVGLPDDVVNPITDDPESLLDEIMGHLYGDDWMITLMNQGEISW